MIFNEINFIRQLKICENIVQIDQVYSCTNAVNGKKMIFIVMKFAKYGSVLRLILKNCQFTETQIRNILEQLSLGPHAQKQHHPSRYKARQRFSHR